MRRLSGFSTAFLSALAVPFSAFAQFNINTGIEPRTLPMILGSVTDLLAAFAMIVTLTIFLYGAIMMIASGGSENIVQKGKSIMKAALIGMAIIAGSWILLSTFLALLRQIFGG